LKHYPVANHNPSQSLTMRVVHMAKVELIGINSTAYVIVCTITSPGVMAKDCAREEERVR